MTLYSLYTDLGIRLNDAGHGQWSLAQKKAYLNKARRRTAVRTKSYQSTSSQTLVASTHTYDFSPIFLLRAGGLRLGDNTLEILPIGSLKVVEENWDALPAGTPTRALPLGGGRFRLAPTPDAGAAGIVGSVTAAPVAGGTGYTVNDILSLTTTGTGAKVKATAVGSGIVTAVALHSTTDSKGRTVYYRGTGYATGTSSTTNDTDTASGTGCTVTIATLCKLEAYGAASLSDLGAGVISVLAAAPTAAGTGYSVGDILTITTGGTRGTARVLTLSGSTVATVELVDAGVDYTTGTGKVTGGGTGSGCTLAITTVTDGTYLPVTDLSDAWEEALLLAAEEEAYAARPSMPGAGEIRTYCHQRWEAECEQVKVSLGIA